MIKTPLRKIHVLLLWMGFVALPHAAEPKIVTEIGEDEKTLTLEAAVAQSGKLVKSQLDGYKVNATGTSEIIKLWIAKESKGWNFPATKVAAIQKEAMQKVDQSVMKANRQLKKDVETLKTSITDKLKSQIKPIHIKVHAKYTYQEGNRDRSFKGWALEPAFVTDLGTIEAEKTKEITVIDGIDLSKSIGKAGKKTHIPFKIIVTLKGKASIGKVDIGKGCITPILNAPTSQARYYASCAVVSSGSSNRAIKLDHFSYAVIPEVHVQADPLKLNIDFESEIKSNLSLGTLLFDLKAKPSSFSAGNEGETTQEAK